MEGLVEAQGAPIQGLLDEPDHGWRDADRAVDRASARFGAGSVRPASLIRDRDRPPPGCPKESQQLPAPPRGSAWTHPDNVLRRTASAGARGDISC